MTIVLTLIGLIVGLVADEAWGAVLGALVGFLLGSGRTLQRQVRQLQFQVLQLQQGVAGPRGATTAASAATAGVDDGALVSLDGHPPSGLALPRAAFESFDDVVEPSPARAAAVPAPVASANAATDTSRTRPAGVAGAGSVDPLAATTHPPARPPAPPRPSALAPLWRWLVGGNTIVKAGIAILFIGLAFLAKFASEQVTLSVETRLMAVGAVALVLMVVGWRLRLRRPGYAQVLQGGAVAVLYLTLFVAMRWFGVIGAVPALVAMLLVAVFSAVLAVLQNARSLAVVGALGGFATPLLVATGGGNVVGLFALYLLLDIGIALVAWHRIWRSLNLIGFVFTFGIAGAWGLDRYQAADYGIAQAFLVAYFLLFVAVLLMPGRRLGALDRSSGPAGLDAAGAYGVDGAEDDSALQPGTTASRRGGRPLGARLDRWVDGSLLFGLPTVVFALQYGLVKDTAFGVALSALVLAAFYIGLARWLKDRRSAVAFEGSLAVGVVFVTLVIPFALDASSTAGAWALEGAGLVWLGFRQSRARSRWAGYALVALSGVALAIAYEHAGPIVSVFDGLSLGSLLLAAGSLAAGWVVSRHGRADSADPPRDALALPESADASSSAPMRVVGASADPDLPTDPSRVDALPGTAPGSASPPFGTSLRAAARRLEPSLEYPLVAWAVLWLVTAVGVHIDRLVGDRPYWTAAWLVAGSVLAVGFAELSRALRWRRVALPAALQAPLLVGGVLALAAFSHTPVEHGGWWVWPLALATHLWLLRRMAPGWPRRVRHAVHVVGVLVLAALGAMQGSALTLDFGDDARGWSWLGWFTVPALLIGWIGSRRGARAWPVRDAPRAYRWTALALLSFVMLGFTLLANLFADGQARPLPYVPLLNPLDLGIAAVLLAVTAWLAQRTWRSVAADTTVRRPSHDPSSPDAAGRDPASPAHAAEAGVPVDAPAASVRRGHATGRALCAWLGLSAFAWLNGMLLRGFFHYGGVPYELDAWFESLAVQSGLTLLWTLTALVAMWLSARRGWRIGWITGAALLGLVVVKLLTLDLSASGTIARIVSFIGAGAVMLVIGYVAPLPSKAKGPGPDDAVDSDDPGDGGASAPLDTARAAGLSTPGRSPGADTASGQP